MLPFGKVRILADALVPTEPALCEIGVTTILPFGSVLVLKDWLDSTLLPVTTDADAILFSLEVD